MPKTKSKSTAARRRPTVSAPVAPSLPKLVYDRAEAATVLGFCLTTIDGLIASKTLRASKIGRRVVIRAGDIDKMLEANNLQ